MNKYNKKSNPQMLEMRPLDGYQAYYNYELKVNYRPVTSVDNQSTPQSIIPTFNHDEKDYTPSFMIPSFYSTRDIQHKSIFSARRKEALHTVDQDQIYVPKPKSLNMYCAVCRRNYWDYLEHINSQQHCLCIKQSPFTKEIQRIVYKVGKNTAMMTRAKKRRNQKNQYDTQRFIKEALYSGKALWNSQKIKNIRPLETQTICDSKKEISYDKVEFID